MRNMDWRKALVFVALVALLVGCRGQDAGITDRKLPKPYANIVSLSPSTTEVLAGFGATNFLVGRTESCDRPPSIASIAIVVRSTKPDYEAILGLEPDLIMYDKSLYSDDEIAKIKDLKIETLEYDPKTIDDYARFCHVLASKLSMEVQVSKQVDYIYAAVEAAKGHPTTKPKTTILLGDGKSYDYLVLGKESFHAHILQECGATVVGADGRPFQSLNVERFIDMDPDVIYSDGNAQSIYSDPRLQSISAVKNMHVYDVDAKTIVRIGDQLKALIERFDDDLHRLPANRPQVAAR